MDDVDPSGKQGTPVRIRDGPAAVFGRFSGLGNQGREKGQSHSSHCRVAPAAGGSNGARRHAAVRVRESEDLPGVMSLSDREGGMAGTAAAAAGRMCRIKDPLLHAPVPGARRAGVCAANGLEGVRLQPDFAWNAPTAGGPA
jgi:hypothetical protein